MRAFSEHQNTGQTSASDWRYSSLWSWFNNEKDDSSFINTSFASVDKWSILRTSKESDCGTNYLKKDYLYIPSSSELGMASGVLKDGVEQCYYLRNPYSTLTLYFYNPFFGMLGSLSKLDWWCSTPCGVRPSFNLNGNSVLFTQPASNGSPDPDNIGALTKNTAGDSDSYKLTLLNKTRDFRVNKTEISAANNELVTFNYTGAVPLWDKNYISAMIVDDDDTILYYGQLQKAETKDGTRRYMRIADSSGHICRNIYPQNFQ